MYLRERVWDAGGRRLWCAIGDTADGGGNVKAII